MPTKDYNIQPYYDDFDETKGYHRVLFKPNFAVQARELTQLQTTLQDQIQKNSGYENGESISSGQLNIYTDIAYLSLSSDLTANETAESIVGKVITNQTSLGGVTAKIIAVAPKNLASLESLTVYVAYLDNLTSASTFVTGDNLYEITDNGTTVSTTAWKTIGLISTYTTPTSHVGTGSIAQIESGIYYVNGYATYVSNQTIILDKFGITPSYKIGFDVSETIATSSDDVTLNDNSVTSNNYQAPGADRHKILLTLSKRSLTVSSTENFVEICEVVDGVVNKKKSTSDSKGSIVVSGLDYELRENLSTLTDVNGIAGTDSGGSADKISFGVSAGVGNINGKEVRLKEKTYLAIDKPRTSVTKSTTIINSGAELGNYVVTDGNLNQLLNNNSLTVLNFAPESGDMYPLVFFASTTGTTDVFIGKARIRSVEREGTDFRIYLFDIQMDSGKTISEASELHRWTSGGNYTVNTKFCDLKTERSSTSVSVHGEDVTPSTLRETNKNALLHEMPYKGISRVDGTVSISKIRRTFAQTATNANTITLSPSSQTFVDTSSVIVYGRDDTISGGPYVAFSSSDLTITASGSTLTIVSSGKFKPADANYIVIATVSTDSATRSTRTPEAQYDPFTTKASVERTIIPLTKTNAHPYSWKVYMSANFGTVATTASTDITDRYTLDTGQRDDYIDFASINLKTNQPFPSGRITVIYWHYPAGAGIYVDAQSYPIGSTFTQNNGTYGNVSFVSNSNGSTTYNLSDIPIFTSLVSGKKFRLNECIDLRPTRNSSTDNGAFNGSGARGMFVPDKTTISVTGIVQYLGRIDKIYLSSDGLLGVKSGVASTNPSIPDNPSDGIPLYNVKLLPYTYDLHDVMVKPLFDDGQRDTDFDAISSLEQSTKDYQLDVGRVRRNTFSDPFVGHGFANVADKEYSAAIDMQRGEMRAKYTVESLPFLSISRVNHTLSALQTTLTVGEAGSDLTNVVTLPYASTVAEIQNLDYNAERTLRNTDAITYNGVVYIKEWNSFKSTKSRPMIKNRTGDFDSIPYIEKGFNAQGTIWNEWETEWYGVKDSHIADPKLDMAYNELDKSPNYYNVVGKEINDKKVEGNYTPYIESKTITINAYGLKPNCAITSVKFDGIEISASLTPASSLYTDNNGTFSKTYIIPNVDESVGSSKFTTGSKKIVISGNGNYAEGYYHAVGLFDDDGYLTKPYDLSWDEQTNETMFQEFEIFDECCVTKLDLYFSAEDLFDRAVTIQLRKMENGKPSNKVLPYSIVSKTPADMAAVSTGTEVTFTFDETIYLQRGKYAIGIVTPSVDYKVQTLKVEQQKGSKGTGVGNLFIGTHKIADEILRFSLHRAKFTATADDAIIGSNYGNTLLNPNPIRTKLWSDNADVTLIVDHEGHGFKAGETVQFDGIKGRTEHDLFVTGNLTFTGGEVVYNSASVLSGKDVYGVPYGRLITQDNVKKTMSIATESGTFDVGDTIRGSSSGAFVVVASDGVHTVKRMKGLHLGASRSVSIWNGNSGSGYSDTGAGIGVATTNVTGSGTGLRVSVSTTSGGAITGTPSVIFGGYGYETGDVVAVAGGTGGQLSIVARGVTVDSHTIMSTGLTADSYSLGGENLVTLGGSGYAGGEDTVTVSSTKRRVDLIRYNAKQFVPDGTTLTWEESDDFALTTTDSVDVNTNIPYTQSRYLPANAVLQLTMSGDASNDRLSPVLDMGSAKSLTVTNSIGSANYISRKLELGESANSVYVVFDAMLSQGNLVSVWVKTMESSSQTTFDSEFTDTLQANITTSTTNIPFSTSILFNVNDVLSIGEEQMLVTSSGVAVSVSEVTDVGASYTNGTGRTLSTSGGSGTGATVLVNVANNQISGTPTIASAGSGYKTNDILNILDGSATTATIKIVSGGTVTRGYNQTLTLAHSSGDVVTKEAVSWTQLTQVGTTFDADFPEFKKLVYSIDDLSDFSVLGLKINMTASNYAMPPRIKNLRVIPNYKDDSLKPMQTKTTIVSRTSLGNSDFDDNAARIETIATDFVIEEATVFITEIKLTSGGGHEQISNGGVEIKRGSDGKVTPLNATNNTGCTVRFKGDGTTALKNITAVVVLTGRRI